MRYVIIAPSLLFMLLVIPAPALYAADDALANDDGVINSPAYTDPADGETVLPGKPGVTSPDEDYAVPISQEEMIESELPETQFNYELDISITPSAGDVIGEDYIRSPIRIKYGLTDNWEISVEPKTYLHNFFRSEYGLKCTDIVYGTKYRFKRLFKDYFNTALSYRIVDPVYANPEISDGFHHYRPGIHFSKTLKDFHSIRLSSSIGVDLVRDPGMNDLVKPNDSVSVSLGAKLPSEKINYTLETIYITDKVDNGVSEVAYITPGMFLKLKDWYADVPGVWSLGTGVRFGLIDDYGQVEFVIKLKLHLRLNYKIDLREMKFKKRDKTTDTPWVWDE